MPQITLADGSQKQFDAPVTALAVAESIGPGLAKAALAAEVDGQMVDISFLIESDAALRIITSKDLEGVEVLRHSAAHLLAHAIKALYPEAQITIGPVVENGFYYDISYERSFTPEDIEKIEAKMKALAKEDLAVTREVLERDQAIELFESMGEHYKVEIIKDIPNGELLTAYRQGDFIDLCRGPHVPRTGLIKAFKLTKLAGAYWRGDSNNEMLQRVYGTAWPDKKALNDYLHRLEEAEKRDHRKLAKKMDLFHINELSPGNIFWHENGWDLVLRLRDYVRKVQKGAGYQEINTPQVVNVKLWEQTGHLEKFDDDIFLTGSEEHQYAIKPMNCPCHVLVFNQGLKSYRDLPIRYAEFGCCHRNEPSGTLHGLFRLRGFVQDDAHIFCTEDQIESEVIAFIDQLYPVYADFGFEKIEVRLSTRPEKRVGSDELWDKAEGMLKAALEHQGVAFQIDPGEGAFYGPKIEFILEDCLGRNWTCGTIQLDFAIPQRLGAQYVAEDGSKQVPVMLHRAMLGSIERFIGMLLEHHEGKLPLWLAPTQVVIMNITDRQADHVAKLVENFKNLGFRVISDLRNEKIGYKIREHTIKRIPYQLVIGDREVEENTVAVRTLDGQKTESMSVDAFVSKLQEEIEAKRGYQH